jgi:hypothetical protein
VGAVSSAPDPPGDARRVSVPAARLRGWLAGFDERHGTALVVAAPTQVLLTGADGARAWIEVPFPPLRAELADHVELERRVGVLLVRRGGYAAGVFAGETLVASKVGTSYVQGTTKAGGSSQKRYARRRANQADVAFAAAADVAARVLVPEAAHLAAVVLGGDRFALDAVLADPRLEPLRALVAGPLLAVGDPRLRVLHATPEQFRAVRITLAP